MSHEAKFFWVIVAFIIAALVWEALGKALVFYKNDMAERRTRCIQETNNQMYCYERY